jgi:hypothetical protein
MPWGLRVDHRAEGPGVLLDALMLAAYAGDLRN